MLSYQQIKLLSHPDKYLRDEVAQTGADVHGSQSMSSKSFNHLRYSCFWTSLRWASMSRSLFCVFAASPDVSWQQRSCSLFRRWLTRLSPISSFFLFTVWVHFVWPRSPDQSAVGPLQPAARLAAHSSSETPVKTCPTDSAALNCNPPSETSLWGTTPLWIVQLKKFMHWKNPWSFPELLALSVFQRLLWQNYRSGPSGSDCPGPEPHWRLSVTGWHHKMRYSDVHHSDVLTQLIVCIITSEGNTSFTSIFLTIKHHVLYVASL